MVYVMMRIRLPTVLSIMLSILLHPINDDVTIEEHTMQITGGPLASMMSIENPESFADVICVASAEGQCPLY